jgi:prepilin-type N-terminal cleavage/methylation domain-containing protein
MKKQTQTGFTIVELLIVIVVIGILAAITVVAYNGVQDRARVAAVSSSLAGAAKQLELARTDTDLYPADATAIQKAADIDYQYTSTGATYCLTATKGTLSYKISNTSTAPSKGGCAGHGVGGIAAVTNFVLNPSFENNSTANGGNISASGGSRAIIAGGAPYGAYFLRATFTDVTTLGWGQHSVSVPTGSYAASFYIRSDIGIKFQPYLQGTATKATIASSGTVTAPANTWTRAWTTVNVTTAGTIQVGGYFVKDVVTPTTSNYIDFDGFMLSAGTSVQNYADGTYANWIWNGAANEATSTGPAV